MKFTIPMTHLLASTNDCTQAAADKDSSESKLLSLHQACLVFVPWLRSRQHNNLTVGTIGVRLVDFALFDVH